MGICCMAQETQTGALYQPRQGWGGEGDGRFKREGTYRYLWMSHVEVWQKSTKFCKAVMFQFKKKAFLPSKTAHLFQSSLHSHLPPPHTGLWWWRAGSGCWWGHHPVPGQLWRQLCQAGSVFLANLPGRLVTGEEVRPTELECLALNPDLKCSSVSI